MDWSDEYFSSFGHTCPFEPNAIECDEHVCTTSMYSCGDGQCVRWDTRMAFHRFSKPHNDCFNKRNLNYMCEVSPHRRAWTLQSGLCWPDENYDDPRYPPWNVINASQLSDDEKCQYLFRCVLSKGFEQDCPCNHRNCTQMMVNVCQDSEYLIRYPAEGLINPNVQILYNYTESMENPTFQSFRLIEGLKCRGYFYQTKVPIDLEVDSVLVFVPFINHHLCTLDDPEDGYRNFSTPHQNDQFCWNDSVTFNGRPYAVNHDICTTAGECISQYRIRDGFPDCIDNQDEKLNLAKNYCTGNVGRHRFQCYSNEHKCVLLHRLGTGTADCSNNYDESWYGTGTNIQMKLRCTKGKTTDCHLVKDYIQQSSTRNSSDNSLLAYPQQQDSKDRMPFLHYCDSFWTSDNGVDEMPSSCQHWICQKHEYRCRTGQCIELSWVCDGEWDCSDASDEEAFALHANASVHNTQLPNLRLQLEKCRQRYSKSPFSNICNTTFELGCYLSWVSNPLDFQLNRPCINLTQIGDGVEDCHNAYDEKNTFKSISRFGGMWGFHFLCGTDHKSYADACNKLLNCSQPLCSYYHDKDGSCSAFNDFICLGNDSCKKNARCNGKFECMNGEDEYWCPSGTLANRMIYRIDKYPISRPTNASFVRIFYPSQGMLQTNQTQLSRSIVNLRNAESLKIHSYQCNRGISVLEMNQIRCLCPPAYHGDWCQFFSDRISIIAHIDQNRVVMKTISNATLKIRANFLFNGRIIDHHEFHIIPVLEKSRFVKHKFYLLYSRSPGMLEHKRWRYFNRTDLINNHPYSVHFDVFVLEEKNSLEELGSWHYPIYFDYLPAFRMAIVLKFPSWLGNATLDPCLKNSCNENSTCLPVFNQNSSFYCSCENGYYGMNCSTYEPLCESYCSANSLCRRDDSNLLAKKDKPDCICQLGHFGARCNLKYHECNANSCLNNGTCFPNYDASGENPYQCICSERFYGSRCQDEKASVHINLNMINKVSARAVVVQLYNYHLFSLLLSIQHQEIYNGLPLSIRYYHSDIYAPQLGVLKIYDDFLNPQYYLMYFLNQSKINITLSPQYCPQTSLLLFEG